jgi:Zinc finger, C2H2 type
MEYRGFSNGGAKLVAEDSVSNFELLQALQPPSFPFTRKIFKQTGSPNLDGIAVTQNGAEGPHRERFSCDWPDCTTTFARRADYNRHLKERHLPVQRYMCTFLGCNKTYNRRDKLQSHERHSHNPEVCISEKDSSSAIPQTIHDIGSLDMIFENHASKEAATSSSSWTAVDEHARFQDFNSDTNRSSPVADYSCGPSEDFFISSDEFSRKGSMSVTSTSSNRTVLSRNRIELLSTSQTEETDHAERKFACPYRKHNPGKYNINNHRTCAASGWDSIPRVKYASHPNR